MTASPNLPPLSGEAGELEGLMASAFEDAIVRFEMGHPSAGSLHTNGVRLGLRKGQDLAATTLRNTALPIIRRQAEEIARLTEALSSARADGFAECRTEACRCVQIIDKRGDLYIAIRDLKPKETK